MRNHFRQWLWVLLFSLLFIGGGTLIVRGPAALAQLDLVVVAVDLVPPFAWKDETGALQGFEIELIDALAAQAGLQIVYEKVEFRYLLPGIATRLYDVGAACLSITPERQTQVHFTRPYFATGLTLVVPATMTTTVSLADLTPELTIGVLGGSVAETVAHAQTTAVVHALLTVDDLFARVETGELQAAIVSETAFLGYRLRYPQTTLQTMGGLLTYSECGLAVNLGDPVLLDHMDLALVELKSNGTYDTIYHKWFGDRPLPEKPVEPTPTATALVVPTPTPVTLATGTPVTDTAELAGIYYLTVSAAPTPDGQAAARYQILTLAANGLWFVTETPDQIAASSAMNMAQTGQPGFWYVDADGAVEAMVLTFTAPAPANGAAAEGVANGAAEVGAADIGAANGGMSAVIRKDYAMKVDSNGTVVGTYYATSYAANLFALGPVTTGAITQTVEFTGQRVQ